MQDEIRNIRNEFMALVTDAQSPEEIEQLRVSYLGRNGKINLLTKSLKELPNSQKAEVGALINQTKVTIESELLAQQDKLSESTTELDTTIPGIKPPVGHTHLLTESIREIERIFTRLGFVRRRYPEVEWDWYSFTSLNFPKNHPAWDTLETYFVDAAADKNLGEMVLTPHTSNGQVREMRRGKLPIRMINIGKTYRRQADISHTPMFHQFEGLVVDKDIAITHLKGTLDYFAKAFFGESRKVRLRPHNFRFTEPSFEVDITCDLCDGRGCRVCKGGWLELGGCGMVHPNVLRAGGVDPEVYSGFAFGWGVERVTMMKSGINIPDLRVLYSTDLRYLEQF